MKDIRSLVKSGEIKPEELFSSRAFYMHLKNIMMVALTDIKRNLRRSIGVVPCCMPSSNMTAYTDGTSVHINTLGPLIRTQPTLEKMYYANVGHMAHECCHILFTDFCESQNRYQSMFDMDMSFQWFRYEPSVNAVEIADFLNSHRNYRIYCSQIYHNLDNLMEDVYIENRMYDTFHGTFSLGQHIANDQLFEHTPSIEEMFEQMKAGKVRPIDLVLAILQIRALGYEPKSDGSIMADPVFGKVYQDIQNTLVDCKPFLDDLAWQKNSAKRSIDLNEAFARLFKYVLLTPIADDKDQKEPDGKEGKKGDPKRSESSNSSSSGSSGSDSGSSAESSDSESSSTGSKGSNSSSDSKGSSGSSKESKEDDNNLDSSKSGGAGSEKDGSDKSDESEKNDSGESNGTDSEENSEKEDANGTTDGSYDSAEKGDSDEKGDTESTPADAPDLTWDDLDNLLSSLKKALEDAGRDTQNDQDESLNASRPASIEVEDMDQEKVNKAKEESKNLASSGAVDRGADSAFKDIQKEEAEEEAEEKHEAGLRKEAGDIKSACEKAFGVTDTCGEWSYVIHRQPYVRDNDIDTYNSIYAGVKGEADSTVRKLNNVLKERERAGYSRGYTIGRFDSKSLVKSSFYEDGKCFKRRNDPTGTPKTAFAVLVDMSGSMEMYGKYERAREAAIMLDAVLKGVGCAYAIFGHTDDTNSTDIYAFKDFEKADKYDSYRLAGIRALYGNRDGAAIAYCAEKLLKRPEPKRVLIVISDGAPTEMAFADSGSALEDTKRVIEIYRQKKVVTFGAVIDGEVDHIRRIYGEKTLDLTEHGNLSTELTGLVKRFVVKR